MVVGVVLMNTVETTCIGTIPLVINEDTNVKFLRTPGEGIGGAMSIGNGFTPS
jgi:hypothetical protein